MATGSSNVVLHPGRYNAVRIAVGVAIIPLMLFGYFLGRIQIGSFSLWADYWLWIPLAFYIVDAFKVVDMKLFGGIEVFGVPTIEFKQGGIKFAPRWLTKIHTAPREEQEDQFPDEPENIAKNTDNRDSMRILSEPMRITTGAPKPGEDEDPLNASLTLEPTIVVTWQVEGAPKQGEVGFFEFFINIAGNTWAEKKATIFRRMRDTAQAVLSSEFKDRSARDVIADQDAITAKVLEQLSQRTSNWGITICNVQVLDLDPASHAVNSALGEIPQAKAKARAIEITAEANKRSAILGAEGQAEGRERLALAHAAEIAAEGDGMKKKAEALGISGADVLAAEVVMNSVGKGDTVVLAKDLGDVAGLAATLLKKKDAA